MSKEKAAPARHAQLAQAVRRHRELYYAGRPEITDAEYDALEEELRALEAVEPAFAESSPLGAVGAPAELFSPVRHERPMLSLDKATDERELGSFVERFAGEELLAIPKLDGVSLALRYDRGRLTRAATRGDGQVGEDVTQNVAEIAGAPGRIDHAGRFEVRGEVVMLRADFEAYNAAHPAEALANPRNGAAGALRAKDRAKVAGRKLTFLAFDANGGGSHTSGALAALAEHGFEVPEHAVVSDLAELVAYVSDLAARRDELAYEIDGAVVRLDEREAYREAGTTSHHPKGAIAFKWAAEQATTRITAVSWQVGKVGVVSPVAEVEPVFVGGTTIRRATLHNLSVIREKDVRVGDRVVIQRAGDVIPQIVGPADRCERDGSEREIAAPGQCPSCATALVRSSSSGSEVWECPNGAGCPAQALRRLIHWCSRAGADVEAVGETWLGVFAEAGIVARPSDLYRLQAADLMGFERMGERLAGRMLGSIQASKGVGLRKALVGWAIPLASEGTAARLCRAGYESVEQVAAASVAELQQVEDIGPAVAASLSAFLRDPAMAEEIGALRQAGVVLDVRDEDRPKEVSEMDQNAFTGKNVVITGTLTVPRQEFQALVVGAGGLPAGSVSKKTDYLVCGQSVGRTKTEKAAALGVTVLSESEAREMLNGVQEVKR